MLRQELTGFPPGFAGFSGFCDIVNMFFFNDLPKMQMDKSFVIKVGVFGFEKGAAFGFLRGAFRAVQPSSVLPNSQEHRTPGEANFTQNSEEIFWGW
jgi:hypothetical protein